MRGFFKLALVAAASVYFLIFVGGLVRVSGAGLGCPDWPQCFGRWIPPTNISQLPPNVDPARFNFVLAWIEYINRLIGMTVGLLVAATAIWALMAMRKYPRILWPAIAAALIVAYQGWQGGQVVSSALAPYLVSIHMGLAFVIAALATYVAQQAWYVKTYGRPQLASKTGALRRWMAVLATMTVVQVISGTQVREAIEYIVRRAPLMKSSEWWNEIGSVNEFHLVLGIIVTFLVWQVGAKIIRHFGRNASPVKTLTWVMMSIATAEIIIGAVLAMVGVTGILQLFHLLMAGLVFGMEVLIFSMLRYEGGA